MFDGPICPPDAAVVLCVSRDLEDRMRGAGARDVRRALVPPYDPEAPAESPDSTSAPDPEAVRAGRADLCHRRV